MTENLLASFLWTQCTDILQYAVCIPFVLSYIFAPTDYLAAGVHMTSSLPFDIRYFMLSS